jgi:biopolymer transport protein ExbD
MRRRSSQTQGSQEEVLLNLTPLIDVIFVILVMFMLVAPMLNLDEVSLANARAESSLSSSQADKNPVRIYVKQDNSIALNDRKISFEELQKSLPKLKALHPDAIPIVFHDKRAQFGTYQNLKNEIESAGFEQMQIVLKPSP